MLKPVLLVRKVQLLPPNTCTYMFLFLKKKKNLKKAIVCKLAASLPNSIKLNYWPICI